MEPPKICYNQKVVKRVKNDSSKSLKRYKKSKNGEKATPVKSIFRAARILQCLDNNIHSIKEIASDCQLSMATVHRILQTLEESQLVFQEPVEHKYYLGTLFTQMALNRVNTHRCLLTQAFDEINRISNIFGEYVAFDVEIGLQIVSLIHIPSRFNFSISKLEKPMYYGSVSKVIMAQKSDAEIEIILNNIEPKPTSNNCNTDKEKFREEFKTIRRQGYCISRREIDEGVMGISVPVNNYICPTALSIIGPEIRLDPIAQKVTEEMLVSAGRISDRLSLQKSGFQSNPL